MQDVNAGRDARNLAAGTYIEQQHIHAAPSAGESSTRANIPPLAHTFIPRPDITKKIHAALTGDERTGSLWQAAARAYGGYGKTVAAILYAHEHKDAYPGGRFFLSVESASLASQLASLGLLLGVPDELDENAAAKRVKLTLESGPDPALLILDNVRDADHWRELLETDLIPRGDCRVLITTRAERIPIAADIPVGRFTPEEAREVYRRFCEDLAARGDMNRPPPTDEEADAITELVAGLAVAVAGVGALMKLKPHLTWAEYAARLRDLSLNELPDVREDVRAELGLDGKALDDHRRTLQVIDDALDALPPAELRAVEYAALLPEDMVPEIWLEALLDMDFDRAPGSNDSLALAAPDDPDDPMPPAQRVIGHLAALDVLLPKGEDGHLLSLHRLWRARVRERDEDGTDCGLLWSAIDEVIQSRRTVLVGESIDHPAVLTRQELRWELTPLAEVVAAAWSAGRPGDAARTGVWLGWILRLLGRFSEAAACLRPVSEHEQEVEHAIGPENLGACYSNLATIQEDLGELKEAKANIECAIEIGQKHFDPDHPNLATCYSNLAMIQQALGEGPAAKANMQRAIKIDEKHFDPDHPNLAIRYSNLALIQKDLGELKEAEANMQRAIDIFEKHLDPDHPNLATIYSNLAAIQKALGELAPAKANMQRAIEILEKHFDSDHPNLTTSYSNLALIQKDLGEGPAAKANMQRAIEIEEKHLDPDHPTLASSWHNLAGIVFDEGDAAGAAELEQKALDILLKHFTEAHPHVRISRWHLAQYRAAVN